MGDLGCKRVSLCVGAWAPWDEHHVMQRAEALFEPACVQVLRHRLQRRVLLLQRLPHAFNRLEHLRPRTACCHPCVVVCVCVFAYLFASAPLLLLLSPGPPFPNTNTTTEETGRAQTSVLQLLVCETHHRGKVESGKQRVVFVQPQRLEP